MRRFSLSASTTLGHTTFEYDINAAAPSSSHSGAGVESIDAWTHARTNPYVRTRGSTGVVLELFSATNTVSNACGSSSPGVAPESPTNTYTRCGVTPNRLWNSAAAWSRIVLPGRSSRRHVMTAYDAARSTNNVSWIGSSNLISGIGGIASSERPPRVAQAVAATSDSSDSNDDGRIDHSPLESHLSIPENTCRPSHPHWRT